MRYYTTIEVEHLAGGEPLSDSARSALTTAMLDDLRSEGPLYSVSDFLLSPHPRNVILVHTTLRGKDVKQLISPLDALIRVDDAFRRALAHTGLFEEFDVARRTLRVGPI